MRYMKQWRNELPFNYTWSSDCRRQPELPCTQINCYIITYFVRKCKL